MNLTYNAPGKLLLSGEYFVLDGALALALPTQLGQSLVVKSFPSKAPHILNWDSYNENQQRWFQGSFSLPDCKFLQGTDQVTGERLENILKAIEKQRPEFWETQPPNLTIQTHLEFPRNWGLGTSSTLIVNLATWASVDPYQLLADTFGGSGYDIACGLNHQPLLYCKENDNPKVEPISYFPPFADHLYFVYLGKKQNSREGIARYREKVKKEKSLIDQISSLTKEFVNANSLEEFDRLPKRTRRNCFSNPGTRTGQNPVFR